MWRSAFLYLSSNRAARRIVAGSNLIWNAVGSRFVAGERLEDAIKAALELGRRGADVELDYLGENVQDLPQARAAGEVYLDLLERLKAAGLTSHISLKLTQMGLDVDADLCRSNLEAVVGRAEALGSFVWIDMEGSDYTDRTIETYLQLRAGHPGLGIALQAYLYRAKADLHRILSAGGTVRLTKGAYNEPASIAYPSKRDVDLSFQRLSELLLSSGTFQAIATHDEKMIRHAIEYARSNGVDRRAYEFQMLYGVRRDLQESLLREGYRVRVYVPYGSQWYPYFMRRLAERPANVFFLLGSVLREGTRRG